MIWDRIGVIWLVLISCVVISDRMRMTCVVESDVCDIGSDVYDLPAFE